MSDRVVMTGRAEGDLDRILTRLGATSTDTAARLAERFKEAASRLRSAPLACGPAYKNPRFVEEIRHLLFGISSRRRDRAWFIVREEDVVVLAIRAPGERPLTPMDLNDPN